MKNKITSLEWAQKNLFQTIYNWGRYGIQVCESDDFAQKLFDEYYILRFRNEIKNMSNTYPEKRKKTNEKI